MRLTASQLRQIIQEELQGIKKKQPMDDETRSPIDIFVDNFWDHKDLKVLPRGTYPSVNSTNVEYVGNYVDASFNVAQDEDGQVYATILSDPEEKKHRSVKKTVDAVNIKIDKKKWKP